MLLYSRIFKLFCALNEIWKLHDDLMQVDCHSPVLSTHNLGVQVKAIIDVDDASESIQAKDLRTRKGVLLIKEDLKLEVPVQDLDLVVELAEV